jgi:hypothetical protein
MKLARIFFRKAVKGWKKVSAKKVQKFVEIQEEKKEITTPQSLLQKFIGIRENKVTFMNLLNQSLTKG